MEDNLVMRLWNGEVSLPKTYWVLGVVSSAFVGAISRAIINGSTENVAAVTGLFVLAWLIFVWVATWRSSTAYCANFPSKAAWGILAKVAIIFGVIITFGKIVEGYQKGARQSSVTYASSDTSTAPNRPADWLLAKYGFPVLPMKLDEYFTITAAEVVGNQIITHMYFNGVLPKVGTPEVSTFAGLMVSRTCSSQSLREDLEKSATFRTIFSDQSANNLFYVDVFKSNCG